MRKTAGYTWTEYTTNTGIEKELNIIPVMDKIQEYRRNWLQHINRMHLSRLPTDQQAEEMMGDHYRALQICENKMGQQVAQHHVSEPTMMITASSTGKLPGQAFSKPICYTGHFIQALKFPQNS